MEEGLGLAAQLDLGGVGDEEPGAVEANIGAQVPGSRGRLVCGIAADQENVFRGERVPERGGAVVFLLKTWLRRGAERLRKGGVVRGAVVIDIVGLEDGTRELLEEVSLFVSESIAADDSDGFAAA